MLAGAGADGVRADGLPLPDGLAEEASGLGAGDLGGVPFGRVRPVSLASATVELLPPPSSPDPPESAATATAETASATAAPMSTRRVRLVIRDVRRGAPTPVTTETTSGSGAGSGSGVASGGSGSGAGAVPASFESGESGPADATGRAASAAAPRDRRRASSARIQRRWSSTDSSRVAPQSRASRSMGAYSLGTASPLQYRWSVDVLTWSLPARTP